MGLTQASSLSPRRDAAWPHSEARTRGATTGPSAVPLTHSYQSPPQTHRGARIQNTQATTTAPAVVSHQAPRSHNRRHPESNVVLRPAKLHVDPYVLSQSNVKHRSGNAQWDLRSSSRPAG